MTSKGIAVAQDESRKRIRVMARQVALACLLSGITMLGILIGGLWLTNLVWEAFE